MPIKLGSEKISSRQMQILRRLSRMSPQTRIKYLMDIISDPNILSGQESLDPKWVDIYQHIQSNINNYLPYIGTEDLEEIGQIFSKFLHDDEISKIDPSKVNIAFLLGAGASKPNPSDIPTVKELLPDLLTRARKLDRVDLQKLVDFCNEADIDNIEDLLTAAQLSEFCSRNPSVLKLVDFLIYGRGTQSKFDPYYNRPLASFGDLSAVAFLQDTLQVLFGLLSSRMLPAKPNTAHAAISKYVSNNPPSSIITTNYDCCMDLALGYHKANFSYLVDFANKKTSPESEPEATPLIKLHGSLNWYYCETCQQVHLIDIEKTVKEYLNDENCYSIIAVCKDCGGQRRGLLVPPLAMKFDLAPPLTPLIEKAQDCFNKADAIVVVGFSFADADMYISRMLTKSMQINNNAKIIVFDPDRDVANKLRRQLSLRISRFDERRVIYVSGDCASQLPEFLEGKLAENIDESPNSTQLIDDDVQI